MISIRMVWDSGCGKLALTTERMPRKYKIRLDLSHIDHVLRRRMTVRLQVKLYMVF